MRFFILAFSVWVGFYSQNLKACDPALSDCKYQYSFVNTPYFINYFSNFNLSQADSNVKRVIIAVEGNQRNARSLLKTLFAVTKSQNLVTETAIIAPWFKANEYSGSTVCLTEACDAVEPNEVYWSSDGWKQGDRSLVSPNISSFEVTDLIIKNLIKVFPALQQVIVTGHSAGGQFTQRYAIGTGVEDEIKPIPVEFVVANPSSYLYLDATRPNWAGLFIQGGKYPEYGLGASSSTIPEFIDPYIRSTQPYSKLNVFASVVNQDTGATCNCSDTPCPYERYKYGFDMKPADPIHYMCFTNSSQTCSQNITAENQISRFLKKKVTYILGQLDTLEYPDGNDDLDVSCSGNFQGADRLSRGTYYFESLSRFGIHNHRLTIVGEVGHSSENIYQSTKGKRSLFGGDLPSKEYLAPTFTLRQKATGRYLDAATRSPYTSTTQLAGYDPTQNWIVTKINDAEYTLQQEQTLRYLEGATSTGYSVSIQEYKNSSAQRWLISPVPNESQTYTIQNKVNSRFLDANTSGSYNANTQQRQSDDTQKWILQP